MNTEAPRSSLSEPTLVLRPELLPPAGSPQAAACRIVASRARAVCDFYDGCKTSRCQVQGDARLLFRYVVWHLLQGNVFVVREGGAIAGVAISWADRAADILARAAAGEPQFAWRPATRPGDAIFIAFVIGTRRAGYGWRKLALARWPDWSARRIFCERDRADGRGQELVELDHRLIRRFARGRPLAVRFADHGFTPPVQGGAA